MQNLFSTTYKRVKLKVKLKLSWKGNTANAVSAQPQFSISAVSNDEGEFVEKAFDICWQQVTTEAHLKGIFHKLN
jgi:hypothetical protein